MIIRNKADIEKAVAFLAQDGVYAFDIETNSLNPRSGKLIGFGVCNVNTMKAFYIIMREWRNNTLQTLLTEADVEPVLQKLKSQRLVTHNGAFDTIFTLHQTGVNLIDSIYCDTMLAAHLANENLFNYGLKELSASLFGVDAKAEQTVLKESIKVNGGKAGELYKADSQIIAEYGLKDVILTAKNYHHWDNALLKQGLTKFFYEDETMPLYREVTIPMECRGIRVDIPYLRQSLAEINQDIKTLEDSIQAAIAPYLSLFQTWFLNKDFPLKTFTGKEPAWCKKYSTQLDAWRAESTGYMFNISSKHHLKKLFFDTLKETPLSRTETGLPQVDSDFLDSIASKYEWVQNIIVYNKLNKLKATYIENLLENQEGGIFYPRFSQHRTTSGRYSSDIQQLPRPLESGHPLIVKYTNRIRQFIISKPGYKLVGADQASLEPRVFSSVSGDPALIEIFKKGLDFYSLIALRTEGLQGASADKAADNYLGKVNKAARQKSKVYSLGLCYGMSAYKLKFELNISQEEAQVLVDNYFKAFHVLKQAIESTHKEMHTQGFVKSQAGRIRHLEQGRQLYNKYGAAITDDLLLYKIYSSVPSIYEKAKQDRRIYKNLANNAFNFKVQSLAASIMNKANLMIEKRIRSAGVDAHPALNCHDELVYNVKEKDVELFCNIMRDCMENALPELLVKLEAVPNVGDRYADIK
jgi:DNA polymerase-1